MFEEVDVRYGLALGLLQVLLAWAFVPFLARSTQALLLATAGVGFVLGADRGRPLDHYREAVVAVGTGWAGFVATAFVFVLSAPMLVATDTVFSALLIFPGVTLLMGPFAVAIPAFLGEAIAERYGNAGDAGDELHDLSTVGEDPDEE